MHEGIKVGKLRFPPFYRKSFSIAARPLCRTRVRRRWRESTILPQNPLAQAAMCVATALAKWGTEIKVTNGK